MVRSTDESDVGVTWLMSMFHADWTHHGPTAAEAVGYHLWDELDPESVVAVRRDAALLLRLPAATIEVLWRAGTETGPSFFSGGRTGVTSGTRWMETLTGLCDTWLSGHAGVDAAAAAPAEWDGVELADPVLAEIEAADFLPDEVGRALTECVRRCTPDLAFRLLLRAMQQIGTASGAALSPEHYARLAALGSALRYGEFVVSEVRHLVV
ncbi:MULTISPECIES: hypothetical protein [Streptomyces]|uniref:CdiI immunity protein domain-containing protein n=1 Tax=Streptomyces doebereineriae TaxID=3075528 RepID=A0ABU2VI92_9ACTN|nr:hypothetical protein [Streptomyces sp. DSM 41640]MDT0484914.1 hypothetical protein [Streptomyces sp. DSM 41640]